jgi:hypothetical protein
MEFHGRSWKFQGKEKCIYLLGATAGDHTPCLVHLKKIISLSMCATFFNMNLKSSSFGIRLVVVLGCHKHHAVGF